MTRIVHDTEIEPKRYPKTQAVSEDEAWSGMIATLERRPSGQLTELPSRTSTSSTSEDCPKVEEGIGPAPSPSTCRYPRSRRVDKLGHAVLMFELNRLQTNVPYQKQPSIKYTYYSFGNRHLSRLLFNSLMLAQSLSPNQSPSLSIFANHLDTGER
jgi:hypothetical protein